MMRLGFFTRRNLQHGPPRQDDEEAGGASLHQSVCTTRYFKVWRWLENATCVGARDLDSFHGCFLRKGVADASQETRGENGTSGPNGHHSVDTHPSSLLRLLLSIPPLQRWCAGCCTVFAGRALFSTKRGGAEKPQVHRRVLACVQPLTQQRPSCTHCSAERAGRWVNCDAGRRRRTERATCLALLVADVQKRSQKGGQHRNARL